MNLLNLAGKRFGRLTALSLSENRPCKKTAWNCTCLCGNHVTVLSNNLIRGLTSSCGCLQSELSSKRQLSHGHTQNRISPEYRAWYHMIERCYNPKDSAFKYYGGRGITVCASWRQKFENFLMDLGLRPAGMSLDRKEVNGNYDPGNCRWATKEEQVNNTRRNLFLTVNGVTLTAAQWGRKMGISSKVISRRIACGWSHDRAVTRPLGYGKIRT